jgi:probable rRNA maturation factor
LSVVIQIASICEHPSQDKLKFWAETSRTSLANNNLREIDLREIVLRLVDETEMTELNTTYRGKPEPTNVLSFLAELPNTVLNTSELKNAIEQDKDLPLGDIVICAPVVALEAKKQNKSLPAHWCHMVAHGVLHLYGLDHAKKADATIMEALETKILARLGFPDPYLALKH